MKTLKCEMCNGNITVSGNETLVTCEYCGSQVQLAQASPQEHVSEGQKEQYKLILQSAGSKKITVIKVLRDITGLGLAEAKEAVDLIPTLIVSGSDREMLELEKMQLEEVGARVQLLKAQDSVQVNHVVRQGTRPLGAEQKSGCYIATAVYGSYDCPEVWTLRRFRDDVLAGTWYGKLFIRVYYASSPIAVRRFGQSRWFHRLFKRALDCFTLSLQEKGVSDSPYEDGCAK